MQLPAFVFPPTQAMGRNLLQKAAARPARYKQPYSLAVPLLQTLFGANALLALALEHIQVEWGFPNKGKWLQRVQS
ncbi:MAG TPA: hypothetical protein VK335_07810 [Bryobacteraceae bacterium]|nr:hypothetical protein [Bryobacteraceae bacterium]